MIDDPQERLAFLIDRSRRMSELPAAERTDARRVRGCVSVVWLAGELRDGRCHFRCAADSPMVRGLVAFLCEFYSGATPSEILALEADPLESLGVARNLSPTRRNGLTSARLAIRAFASSHVSSSSGRSG